MAEQVSTVDAPLEPPRSIDLPTVPNSVESTTGKLVFVTLAILEETTPAALSDRLDLPLLELLPVLGVLEEHGIVEYRDGRIRIRH